MVLGDPDRRKSAVLGIRFADNLVPKQRVREALAAGYANRAMTIEPYPANMLLVWDQGSDCIAGQLAALGGTDAVHDAIAPRVLSAPQVGANMRAPHVYVCSELKNYLDGKYTAVPDFTYTLLARRREHAGVRADRSPARRLPCAAARFHP